MGAGAFIGRRAANRPPTFQARYDSSDWDRIEVSNMESPYGIPIYKNIGYSRSIESAGSQIDHNDNPVGLYSGNSPSRRLGGEIISILPE